MTMSRWAVTELVHTLDMHMRSPTRHYLQVVVGPSSFLCAFACLVCESHTAFT